MDHDTITPNHRRKYKLTGDTTNLEYHMCNLTEEVKD